MSNNPIGVFDSGIGGLTVVKEILKVLPNENLIYLGDTARVPYGPRGKEVIKKFALELTLFLLKKNVKFLVVACNTISATVFDEIIKISPVPVLGVIDETIIAASANTKTNIIGVIGTQATISSLVYEKEIKKINSKIKVITQACPLFVPLAEEGEISSKATELIVRKYLNKFSAKGRSSSGRKNTKIDTLILGCTHYPILKNVIQKVVGKNVKLIDSAKPTAEKLKELLIEKKLLNKNKNPKLEFFVTDAPDRVYKVTKEFLKQSLDGRLKEINL